eukprot:361475-Chlamydomonas_euryale.AAC.3
MDSASLVGVRGPTPFHMLWPPRSAAEPPSTLSCEPSCFCIAAAQPLPAGQGLWGHPARPPHLKFSVRQWEGASGKGPVGRVDGFGFFGRRRCSCAARAPHGLHALPTACVAWTSNAAHAA